jgi:hypothetical protein
MATMSQYDTHNDRFAAPCRTRSKRWARRDRQSAAGRGPESDGRPAAGPGRRPRSGKAATGRRRPLRSARTRIVGPRTSGRPSLARALPTTTTRSQRPHPGNCGPLLPVHARGDRRLPRHGQARGAVPRGSNLRLHCDRPPRGPQSAQQPEEFIVRICQRAARGNEPGTWRSIPHAIPSQTQYRRASAGSPRSIPTYAPHPPDRCHRPSSSSLLWRPSPR